MADVQERVGPDGEQAARATGRLVIVDVEGLHEHREALAQFCLAVSEAATRRRPFGARLRPSARGVEVDGVADGRTWPIGRLPCGFASGAGLPATAAIHAIRVGANGPYAVSIALPGHTSGDAGAASGITTGEPHR